MPWGKMVPSLGLNSLIPGENGLFPRGEGGYSLGFSGKSYGDVREG